MNKTDHRAATPNSLSPPHSRNTDVFADLVACQHFATAPSQQLKHFERLRRQLDGVPVHPTLWRDDMGLRIGDPAPNFDADTTEGHINFRSGAAHLCPHREQVHALQQAHVAPQQQPAPS